MFKLIKLELKAKNKGSILRAFKPMIFSILIAFGIICILLNIEYLVSNMSLNNIEQKYLIDSLVNDINENYFLYAKEMSNGIFIVFTSIICGIYFIKDFINNKIQELYLYPIRREKILLSKILIVVISSVFGNTLVKLMAVIFTMLTALEFNISISFILDIFLNSFVMTLIGLNSMIIGFYRKSLVFTVVSGIIISIILCGNIVPNFYLGEIGFIKYGGAFLGVIGTAIIINKAKESDI